MDIFDPMGDSLEFSSPDRRYLMGLMLSQLATANTDRWDPQRGALMALQQRRLAEARNQKLAQMLEPQVMKVGDQVVQVGPRYRRDEMNPNRIVPIGGAPDITPIYQAPQTGGGFSLSPGQTRYDAAGNPIASMPESAPIGGGFSLSPGQTRYDAAGNPIASVPGEPDEEARRLELLTRVDALPDDDPLKQRAMEVWFPDVLEDRRTQAAAAEAEQEADMSALDTSQTMLSNVDQMLTGDGLESAAGISSAFWTIPGSDAAIFEAQLETLKSQQFLDGVDKLKGLGALSDAEGRKVADAAATLSLSLDDKTMRANLEVIQSTLRTAINRRREALGMPQIDWETGEELSPGQAELEAAL